MNFRTRLDDLLQVVSHFQHLVQEHQADLLLAVQLLAQELIGLLRFGGEGVEARLERIASLGEGLVEHLVLALVLLAQADEFLEEAVDTRHAKRGRVRLRGRQRAGQLAKLVVHGRSSGGRLCASLIVRSSSLASMRSTAGSHGSSAACTYCSSIFATAVHSLGIPRAGIA